MPIRSMTGFAQSKGQHGEFTFTVNVKSVNHRFLDLHLRLPANSDGLEMRVRKLVKEHMQRGHLEITVKLERTETAGVSVNREMTSGYVAAFRKISSELGLTGEPDLNVIFRLNGVLAGGDEMPDDSGLQENVLAKLEEAVRKLDDMRLQEGQTIVRELNERMAHLQKGTEEVEKLRSVVLQAYLEKVQSRLQELIGNQSDPDRLLQEAALLADRTDIQEEIVRMKTHIQHFLVLMGDAREAGKKMDFLLQEMNREANTMLSKTSGVSGEALRITELGLAMKADIEKSREQVQNIE
ncbi:MAG TPA: YicC/YloC family endoribonuclease [Terriglobales bacterium]|nr:YicC/YloC family endoribonuclease [Terriglobales bacterium]